MLNESLAQNVYVVGRATSSGIELLGTGFAVARRKIATAAHVSTANDNGLCIILPKLTRLSDYQDTTDNNVNCAPVSISAFDPIRDIAILEFHDATDTAITFGYSLSGSDHAPPGQQVASLGFPHTDLGRLVLTQHVSIVGARILLGSSGTKAKHLVLNTQARPGQSGGPVFLPDGSSVCAMIIGGFRLPGGGVVVGGVDPAILHQTTHAVSAEYIRAMV